MRRTRKSWKTFQGALCWRASLYSSLLFERTRDFHWRFLIPEIIAFLKKVIDDATNGGIEGDKIIIDPGIGFGKTHEHNIALLKNARRFQETGCPILIGHSRKGFIGQVLGDKSADRTAGTLGVSLAMAAAGAQVLRVHDVKPTVDGLKLFKAAGGLDRDD